MHQVGLIVLLSFVPCYRAVCGPSSPPDKKEPVILGAKSFWVETRSSLLSKYQSLSIDCFAFDCATKDDEGG